MAIVLPLLKRNKNNYGYYLLKEKYGCFVTSRILKKNQLGSPMSRWAFFRTLSTSEIIVLERKILNEPSFQILARSGDRGTLKIIIDCEINRFKKELVKNQ